MMRPLLRRPILGAALFWSAACGGGAGSRAAGGSGGDTTGAGPAGSPPAESAPAAQAPTAQAPAATADKIDYVVDQDDVAGALKYDAATKTVTYPIIAGLTPTNSAWNFNGHVNGTMTITVPVGAKMVMPFSVVDADTPHSVGIISGSAKKIPPAPQALAFPGAASRRFELGLSDRERDVVRFTADKPGRYLAVCGVPGHAVTGMWVWFVVSSSAQRPSVTTK